MLELLGPAMSITTAALLAQSSLLKTALDASTIHNAARPRNAGDECPPLARSSRSHRTVMEWLLVEAAARGLGRFGGRKLDLFEIAPNCRNLSDRSAIVQIEFGLDASRIDRDVGHQSVARPWQDQPVQEG